MNHVIFKYNKCEERKFIFRKINKNSTRIQFNADEIVREKLGHNANNI